MVQKHMGTNSTLRDQLTTITTFYYVFRISQC